MDCAGGKDGRKQACALELEVDWAQELPDPAPLNAGKNTMKSMFSDASIQSMVEMIEQLRSSGLDREGLKQEVTVRLVGIALEPPVAHQPTFTTLMTALPVLAASRSTEATADEIQDMREDAAVEGFKPVLTALGDSIIELGTLGGLEAGLVEGMVGRVSLAMAVGLPTDPETLTRR